MSVKITGVDAVLKNLRNIEKNFNKKVMVPAIRKGLVPIERKAKQNCKWESIKKLISKKAFISKKDKQAKGKVFLKPDKNRTVKLEGRDVGFEVVGNILEFGSQKINIRPRPYMRPARDTEKGPALNEVEKEAAQRIKKL